MQLLKSLFREHRNPAFKSSSCTIVSTSDVFSPQQQTERFTIPCAIQRHVDAATMSRMRKYHLTQRECASRSSLLPNWNPTAIGTRFAHHCKQPLIPLCVRKSPTVAVTVQRCDSICMKMQPKHNSCCLLLVSLALPLRIGVMLNEKRMKKCTI